MRTVHSNRPRAGVPAALRTLLAVALALLQTATQGAPADPIIDRVANAYQARISPGAIRETGTTHSQMRGDGPLERVWEAPERLRVTLHYPGGTEERILDGRRAWQGGKPMSEAFRAAMVLQAARTALPWNLLANRSKLRHLGSTKGDDGRLREIVALPLEGSLSLVVEVDAESGRIVRSTGTGIGAMEFATEYGDFRLADGHLYAAREEHYAMGRHIGYSVIDSVSFPAQLDPADFDPAARR